MPGAVSELFAVPRIAMDSRDDGCIVLASEEPLGPHPTSVIHPFREHAAAHPECVFVTERRGDDEARDTVTWGEARATVDALAQSLLDHWLGGSRGLLILSGNSIEHLLLALAAQTVGVPAMPISAAYSLGSSDFARMRAITDLCRPGMVFADDAAAFAGALDAIADAVPVHVIARGERAGARRYADLAAVTPTTEVESAFAALTPETTAKVLFTSGSTGTPKGVITTHGMLASNQQALGQIWPFLHEEPPVLVDWLPCSHTFGGSHNINQVLAFGGTLHIDDGRPVPALFGRTLRSLRETPPTVYYNAPAGYALLAPALEDDFELAELFFSRLRFMFYAAAALPNDLWERLTRLAEAHADHPVPLTASWGTTETAPAATSAHFRSARCGCIGVPLPGTTVKLVPHGDKQEIRIKGHNVTPGYFASPELTAGSFDEEGFYRTGDAVRLVDPRHPERGLMFDGRLAEDFKLITGTWVQVGRLRLSLLATADGALADAVIAGHDREYVAALAWVAPGQAARVCDEPDDVRPTDPGLRCHLAHALTRLGEGKGSAGRIERLILLSEPPSLDAGEITDKGYINQRAVLDRRASEVARLFEEPPADDVIAPAS